MGPKATVLVPLYIYPLTGETWQPLYDAITTHADIEFLVIVNPNSGPGDSPLPSHDYVRELPELTKHSNVSMVGYVLIDYCKRPLRDVYTDIETYAGWSADCKRSGLGVGGIFLDETPNHHTTERAEFLDAVYKHVKSQDGLLGDRLVIHNPGTPPDAALAETGPDVIVTCEEPYDRYQGKEVQKRLEDYHFDPPRSGYMISAVPQGKIRQCVRELRQRGAYIFASDLIDHFYESFGPSWNDFVAAFEDA